MIPAAALARGFGAWAHRTLAAGSAPLPRASPGAAFHSFVPPAAGPLVGKHVGLREGAARRKPWASSEGSDLTKVDVGMSGTTVPEGRHAGELPQRRTLEEGQYPTEGLMAAAASGRASAPRRSPQEPQVWLPSPVLGAKFTCSPVELPPRLCAGASAHQWASGELCSIEQPPRPAVSKRVPCYGEPCGRGGDALGAQPCSAAGGVGGPFAPGAAASAGRGQAARAALDPPDRLSLCSGAAGPNPNPSMEAAVAEVAGAVVGVVGPDSAWATAVLATATGFLVTNAHLLQPGRRAGGERPEPGSEGPVKHPRRGGPRRSMDAVRGADDEPGQGRVGLRVRVRMPGGEWRRAVVVYVFQGPLDLAVLALLQQHPEGFGAATSHPERRAQPLPLARQSALGTEAAGLGPGSWQGLGPNGGFQQGLPLRPAVLCDTAPVLGQRVAVVGHALLHPRAPLEAGVTAGVVARVISESASSECEGRAAGAGAEPAMLLTTAAVHSGASGGAVISASGRLAALVTSNSRHAATGRPLPALNYSIAAAALRPLWETLAAAPYADLAAALACSQPGCDPGFPMAGSPEADGAGLAQAETRAGAVAGLASGSGSSSGQAALAGLRARLRALDVTSLGLASLWALASPPEETRPGADPSRNAVQERGAGVARLARLLSEKGLQERLGADPIASARGAVINSDRHWRSRL